MKAQPEQTTGSLAQYQVPSPWRHQRGEQGHSKHSHAAHSCTPSRENTFQVLPHLPYHRGWSAGRKTCPIYRCGGITLEQIRLNVLLYVKNIRCASKVHLLGEFHLTSAGGSWGYSQANHSTGGRDGSGKCFKVVSGWFFSFFISPNFFFFFFDSYWTVSTKLTFINLRSYS